MTIDLYNMNNMDFDTDKKFDVIFCDYIYENLDFSWVDKYFKYLKNGGVFMAMTDYNSSVEFGYHMKHVIKPNRICKYVWKNEWGQHPKNRPHECYDEIFVYSNTKTWLFQSEKIQVEKATKTKGLNPSGRNTKTATAWIDDCVLTTTALERVKKDDGHLIKWQKPQSLYNRIISPYVNENHKDCLDPFAGSGSFGKWCINNNMNYVGIEYDPETYRYANKNIFG